MSILIHDLATGFFWQLKAKSRLKLCLRPRAKLIVTQGVAMQAVSLLLIVLQDQGVNLEEDGFSLCVLFDCGKRLAELGQVIGKRVVLYIFI